MKPTLYLYRGVPGAGKTTAALELNLDHHYEADMWFDLYNQGKWDKNLIKVAHMWCQAKAISALLSDYPVVVANTFIKRWEMQPYIDAARAYGCPVVERVFDGRFKSVHNVPQETIERMRRNFEK